MVEHRTASNIHAVHKQVGGAYKELRHNRMKISGNIECLYETYHTRGIGGTIQWNVNNIDL